MPLLRDIQTKSNFYFYFCFSNSSQGLDTKQLSKHESSKVRESEEKAALVKI